MRDDVPIIDCHCHAGTGDGLTGPWDTTAPLTDYRRRARTAGIDATVLFAPFSSDYAAANAEVARIVAGEPDRFLGFAFVHPDRDRGRVGRLVEVAVTEYGFRGIKAHRHDGRLTREVCEVADRWRLPVLYDVMGDVAPVELFAAEYPHVAFVIPHLGSFADDWAAQRAFLDILVRRTNVFTDTSGVRRFDLLGEAVGRAEEQRGADDERVGVRAEDEPLGLELVLAVGHDRARLVVLRVRRAVLAVEDEVGREMHEPRAGSVRRERDVGAAADDRLLVAHRVRRVDHHVGAVPEEAAHRRGLVADVEPHPVGERRAVPGGERVRCLPAQLAAEEAGGAGDEEARQSDA